MKAEYFILIGVILVFPLALSFDRNLQLYRHPWALLSAVLGMCLPFWIWDVWGAARGHWWFSAQHTVGIQWMGLPVEEWLFFPIVGFVSIFSWESVKYFRRRRRKK
jgi:lycopene cyclase domain-containing protein